MKKPTVLGTDRPKTLPMIENGSQQSRMAVPKFKSKMVPELVRRGHELFVYGMDKQSDIQSNPVLNH